MRGEGTPRGVHESGGGDARLTLPGGAVGELGGWGGLASSLPDSEESNNRLVQALTFRELFRVCCRGVGRCRRGEGLGECTTGYCGPSKRQQKDAGTDEGKDLRGLQWSDSLPERTRGVSCG